MSRGSIRIWGMSPTSGNIDACIQAFAAEGLGRIVSFQDEWNQVLRVPQAVGDSVVVSSFAESVATCLAYQGVRSLPIVDEKQNVEIVRWALESSDPSSPFFACRAYPGIAKRFVSLLRTLRTHRFRSSTSHGADMAASEVKGRALVDLAQEVETTLSELGLENRESRIERCLATKLPDEHGFHRVLAFVGLDPSPIELDWIEWLIGQGSDVILATLARRSPTGFEASSALAQRFGTLIERVGHDDPLQEALFGDSIAESSLTVRIESSADQLSECEWALRRCRDDLASGNAASQIGIFVGWANDYGPMLLAAAQRLDVPLSMPRTIVLAHSPLIQWISNLLRAMLDDDPRRATNCFFSSFAKAVKEDVSRWTDLARDASLQSDSWNRLSESADGALLELLEWRSLWLESIVSQREWMLATESLLATSLFSNIFGESGTSDPGLQSVAREAVDSIRRRVSIPKFERRMDLLAWIEELESTWKQNEATLAASTNGIRVCSSPVELIGLSSVHALGFLEGVFPRRRTEDPLLNDDERAELSPTGIPTRALPDSHRSARAERDLFLILCAAPTEKLAISYPSAGDEQDNVPAFYLSELERALGGRVERKHHRLSEWAAKEGAICAADTRLAAALAMPMLAPYEPSAECDAALRAIRVQPGSPTSLAELREASQCAFQFGFRRRLNLKDPNEPSEFRPANLLREANLGAIEGRAEARHRLLDQLEIEFDRRHGSMSKEELVLARASAEREIENWLESEWASREVWPRDSGSTAFQVPFDGTRLASEIRIDEETSFRIRDRIAEVGDLGSYRVAKIVDARKAFFEPVDKWGEAEKMEAAIVFAAMGNEKPGAAIEFVSANGDRTLAVKDRMTDAPLVGDAQRGLKVVSLDAKDTKLMPEARGLLKRAWTIATTHNCLPTPGDHCAHCSFGEHCRRSSEFGEQTLFGGFDGGD